MTRRIRDLDLQVAGAFFAIYFLWGTTYYAIRVAVLELPPFLTAGVRFFIAGALLYAFTRFRGQPSPNVLEWRGIGMTALCMFVATYGALFWAEQYVPSGLASVIEASIPIIVLALEVFVLRQQAFSWHATVAVLTGFCGVAWLLLRGGQPSFTLFPCVVILAGALAWSIGTILTRSVSLPASLPMTAGAQMMVGGAVLLLLSKSFGELRHFPHITVHVAFAVVYLIIGGSLIGFTSYIWLLARMPAARVVTHAYVNPVIGLAVGHLIGGEPLSIQIILASALVLASVGLILKRSEADRASAQRVARRNPARA